MKKQKTYVIGDIHGRIEALKEVLKKCKFDYDKDRLIILGDVVDGGFDTYQCVEELMKIKHKILIEANHDQFFKKYIRSGWKKEIWIQQGGANTLRSYGGIVKEEDDWHKKSFIDATNVNIPITHQEFFNTAKYYYIENGMIFVHAGFDPNIPIEKNSKDTLIWDRQLITYAREGNVIKGYDKVFIGHTTTQIIMNDKDYCNPTQFKNLYCLDCGAGWSGKLCIMDIKTDKYWVSKKQEPAIGEKL